jgi:50S ribosomal subunit-associated GTPase HflX
MQLIDDKALVVFNKLDLVAEPASSMQPTWDQRVSEIRAQHGEFIAKLRNPVVFTSCATSEGLVDLLQLLAKQVAFVYVLADRA